ncbi:MAG: hypothetical protein EOO10_15785 [Chitinophagaceae bacterium]|nr:MAG: hypothetical protein EOO10_15785 [Chitinophagaceae bacterium]
MTRFLFSCCLFFCTHLSFGQISFPQSFIGHWEGTLNWYQAGKKVPQKVKMQLIIRPADSSNTYTWQIIYGAKGEDNRPYILRPADTAKGHWQIDERNGIIIDQYFIGNRFTSAFTVQTTTIVDSYWREGEDLVAEFYGLTAKPVNTSGAGTEDSPKVDSYGTKSYQRAILKRIR